jgi:hypothetical protein
MTDDRIASGIVTRDQEPWAEAKKSRMDVEYTSGEELEALLKDVLNQPPEVIEQARKILGQLDWRELWTSPQSSPGS